MSAAVVAHHDPAPSHTGNWPTENVPRGTFHFFGRSRRVRCIKKPRPVRVEAFLEDDPSGIRTRVAAVKGPCPGPLDDGAKVSVANAPRKREGNTMQNYRMGARGV